MRSLLLFLTLTLSLHSTTWAQWISANGPMGGDITFSAANGNTIIAGSSTTGTNNHGQLFISYDAGATWQASLCIDPYVFTDVVFLDSTIFVCGGDAGLFRSNDNGATWTAVVGTVGNAKVRSIEKLGNLVFASGTTVYVSSNNGATWTISTTGLPVGIKDKLATNGQQLYITTYSQMYRSSNQGQTWLNISSGLNGVNITGIAARDSAVFISTEFDGVYYSSNLGTSWTFAGLGSFQVSDVDFYGDTITASTDGGFWYSTNMGMTWDTLNTSLSSGWVKNVFSNDTLLLAGTSGGLCRTNNLQSQWDLIGIPAVDVVGLGGFGDVVFASTTLEDGISAGILVSTDNGNSWTNRDNSLPGAGNQSYSAPNMVSIGNNMLIGWASLGVYLTADTGNTWTPKNNGMPIGKVNSLAAHNGNIYAGMGAGKIYASQDTAQSWSLFSTVPLQQPSDVIKYIAFTDTIMVACSEFGELFISHTFGQSWIPINNGTGSTYNWSFAIKDSTFLIGVVPGGPYRSPNYGANWSPVTIGAPQAWTLAMTAVNNNSFLAGTVDADGILISPDLGINWYDFNDGLYSDHSFLVSRCFYVNSSYVFLGLGSLKGRFSVYKRPLSDFTGLPTPEPDAEAISVYPNPAVGNINIKTNAIIKDGLLELYDITGKLCYTTQLRTGNEWHLELPQTVPGLYFIKVAGDNNVVSTKVLIE